MEELRRRTTTILGPTLEPLELERLAGTPPKPAKRVGLLRRFCVVRGLLLGEESTDTVCRGDLFKLLFPMGMRLTVCVEAPLFMEEREERKLLRELLRSTSRFVDPEEEDEGSELAMVLRIDVALLMALLVKWLIWAAAVELAGPCTI